jgi:hypothetical protein
VNISVKRDEKTAKARQLELVEDYKVIILWASLISAAYVPLILRVVQIKN